MSIIFVIKKEKSKKTVIRGGRSTSSHKSEKSYKRLKKALLKRSIE